ncbi:MULTISPECIES: 1-deoxy-D-xylulose-5-phosphate reductoisomerase [unclassified Ruminococcus]|uniref:1-deoxy-D-xylulose-5-phosphate reductoisomerase n=1 Tax=unclassified Ruminococcus TaxID=2608920 RepID=UPI00210E9C98|nr:MULTISPECIES: 1-deoxy-D-xylulose-5-phosphate reductoisomerase [unclassified Ruminococcus]MCQ4021866.1 1-deoxy-D-xylulose-5-phosphate reductoisomerase [Ruminococcus sp. zg-924]MCQ4114311.1 1-deoxy-D-xylulose-5-phosphate reductoisomerase [Ruminococcus sp. zg-921]
MTDALSILGSTGSIGTQALQVCEKLNIRVTALAAGGNIKLLEQQARKFRPSLVAVFDEKKAPMLKAALKDTDIEVVSGMDGLCLAAQHKECDTVLNSVVGMVGLLPTLTAAKAHKNIALANKETLVSGGSLVMKAVEENGVKLYPVDSEHSAIFQCLQGVPDDKALSRLILTASGGPFFGRTKKELEGVTVEQALKHPNWSMGQKITIDSATMMNKGLEIIEASWLFNMPQDKIDVVVHRESIIHSLIELNDNSVIAQLGMPDMKIPIQYALTYPERLPCPVQRLSLADVGKLTFFEPDIEAFECMQICRDALDRGGLCPAAANGANEEAVGLFLNGKIPFLRIPELVLKAMLRQDNIQPQSVEDVLNADKAARELVRASF